MSKVVRFHEFGGPDVLKLEDEAPQNPGPGEAQLEVRAIGLNRAEAMFRRGAILRAADLSVTNRLRGVRRREIGRAGRVTAFKAGDAVSTLPGYSQVKYGSYAEMALVPADTCWCPNPRRCRSSRQPRSGCST